MSAVTVSLSGPLVPPQPERGTIEKSENVKTA
jgi:hypothetical protein